MTWGQIHDGISGQVLKNCATQLSGIFHSIFQASLSLHKVPTLWKTSIVVPVPKKSRPASPNDLRPVGLTSHVMKSFEKIIKTMIMTRTDHLLDPLQFAYRPGRGVEDAVATVINYVLSQIAKQYWPNIGPISAISAPTSARSRHMTSGRSLASRPYVEPR